MLASGPAAQILLGSELTDLLFSDAPSQQYSFVGSPKRPTLGTSLGDTSLEVQRQSKVSLENHLRCCCGQHRCFTRGVRADTLKLRCVVGRYRARAREDAAECHGLSSPYLRPQSPVGVGGDLEAGKRYGRGLPSTADASRNDPERHHSAV